MLTLIPAAHMETAGLTHVGSRSGEHRKGAVDAVPRESGALLMEIPPGAAQVLDTSRRSVGAGAVTHLGEGLYRWCLWCLSWKEQLDFVLQNQTSRSQGTTTRLVLVVRRREAQQFPDKVEDVGHTSPNVGSYEEILRCTNLSD